MNKKYCYICDYCSYVIIDPIINNGDLDFCSKVCKEQYEYENSTDSLRE